MADAGLTVGPAPELALVAELGERLAADHELAAAFADLTPGRRREYNLYFAGAKQASTRHARVERDSRGSGLARAFAIASAERA